MIAVEWVVIIQMVNGGDENSKAEGAIVWRLNVIPCGHRDKGGLFKVLGWHQGVAMKKESKCRLEIIKGSQQNMTNFKVRIIFRRLPLQIIKTLQIMLNKIRWNQNVDLDRYLQ